MKLYDQIRIHFEPSLETYDSITKLLGVIPNESNLKYLKGKPPSIWTYEVIEEHDDPFYDFINSFLDILENKYDSLASLGIQRKNITFWYIYEYDQQCNMEFEPESLKRLGDNGITLCISCWDSGQELKEKIG